MKREKNEINYVRALFTSILIMLFPFLVVNLSGRKALLLPLVALSFFVAVFLILKVSFKIQGRIKLVAIIISMVYFYIAYLGVLSNFSKGVNIELFDLINVFAKAITLFLFFSLPKNIYLKKDILSKFYFYMIIFGLIACGYNIIINFNYIVNFFSISSSYELALKSFFSNRNQFGSFLFIELTLVETYRKKTKMNKNILLTISLIFIINLILTMSRGALLATVVFYMYVFFMNKGKYTLKFLSGIVVSSFLLMILRSQNFLFTFVRNMIIRPESGTTGRSDIWSIGLSVLVENNIFTGLGLNTALREAKSKGLLLEQFHSFYIEVLLSGGIFELMFVFGTIIFVILYVKKSTLVRQEKSIIYGRLIGFLSLGFFESVGLFSIGYVDIFFSIFLITLPILVVNSESIEFNKYIKN